MGRSFIIFSMAREFKLLFLLSLVVACLGDAVIPDNALLAGAEPAASTTADAIAVTTAVTTADATAVTTAVIGTTPSTSDPSTAKSTDPSVPTTPTSSNSTDPSVPTTPTSSNVTDAETSAPSLTTLPPDPCASNPCGQGSTCEARVNQTFFCLCLPGAIHNGAGCQDAKVFPGDLTVPRISYNDKMANPQSTEFHDAAKQISHELDVIFTDTAGYSGSIVLRLEPKTTMRVWSREAKPPIKATVEIVFLANAEVTTEAIKDAIKEQTLCESCPLKGGSFADKDLCNTETCDAVTSTCTSEDGSFKCNCEKSYVPTPLSNRMCIACPSGQGVDGDKCVKCSFGLSGLNCSESWLRTLVIVASVLGILLLITLIILPIVALKSSKKSPKKNKNADIQEPYVSPIPAKAPLVNDNFANSQAAPANRSANAFANAGVPRIPRATTTSNWDRANLEMTPSNSQQNLVPGGRNPRLYDDDDDMAPYSPSRPQSSLYAQARPQTNPYAQNRPQANPYASSQGQANPYASSQGHTNPYYMQDDGRRFN